MTFRNKILSSIIAILILVPALGININTHICGQTDGISKSLVIPGLLKPKECDKCHEEVVVVKSCCSNKKIEDKADINEKNDKKNCCKDIREYDSYNYINVRATNVTVDYSDIFLPFNRSTLLSEVQVPTNYQAFANTRLRPYVVDILSLNCSYLI